MTGNNRTVPTARQMLIEWANGQDGWIRAIVLAANQTRRDLSSQDLDGIYDFFLREKELRGTPPPVVPALSAIDSAEAVEQPLLLRFLRNVQNVNRLAEGQEIIFNSKLTVVYGENASGKTGYVRILKRLAAVRSAQPVLKNVLAQATSGGPSATIGFALGTEEKSIEWHDEAGVVPLTRTSVFDARAINLHVDEDLTYLYTPGDIALFRYVHKAIDEVGGRLNQEQLSTRPRSNSFLTKFARGTAIYPKIEGLGSSSDVAELERLASIPEDDATQRDALRERVSALSSSGVRSRLELARADHELYEAAEKAARGFTSFDWRRYNQTIEDHRSALARVAEAEVKALEDVGVGAAGREEWQAFVSAGEAYLRILGNEHYPGSEDPCIYCRQPLSRTAHDLLHKYRAYSNDTLKAKAVALEKEMKRLVEGVVESDLDSMERLFSRKIETFVKGQEIPASISQVHEFVKSGSAALRKLVKGDPVEGGELATAAKTAAAASSKMAIAMSELISTLSKQDSERQKTLAEESAKLAELEARLTLRSLLPEIRDHVAQAKWADRAATIFTQRFPPILRSLTTATKAASEQLINEDFERLFDEECRALKAPRVTLAFPGIRGEPARRKMLATEHNLSAILSDGEQNVLAMADFLAECSLRRTPSTIVFDDPVTSMDYKNLRYIVDRIVKLAATHQVVVFTHNVWFTTELLSRFERHRDSCSYFDASASEGNVGIITPGRGPKHDSPTQIAHRINAVIHETRSATGEIRAALLERGYSLVRKWCEAFVEQELFRGIAHRFRPNIMVTLLPQVRPDRMPAAIEVVVDIYEKACRYTEAHADPLEAGPSRETLEELETDWGRLQETRNRYLG